MSLVRRSKKEYRKCFQAIEPLQLLDKPKVEIYIKNMGEQPSFDEPKEEGVRDSTRETVDQSLVETFQEGMIDKTQVVSAASETVQPVVRSRLDSIRAHLREMVLVLAGVIAGGVATASYLRGKELFDFLTLQREAIAAKTLMHEQETSIMAIHLASIHEKYGLGESDSVSLFHSTITAQSSLAVGLSDPSYLSDESEVSKIFDEFEKSIQDVKNLIKRIEASKDAIEIDEDIHKELLLAVGQVRYQSVNANFAPLRVEERMLKAKLLGFASRHGELQLSAHSVLERALPILSDAYPPERQRAVLEMLLGRKEIMDALAVGDHAKVTAIASRKH